MFVATERLNLLLQCNMAQRGRGSHKCIIPSNGNCMGKVRVWVYPRVGSGRVVDIFVAGRVWVLVSIISYGYGSGRAEHL